MTALRLTPFGGKINSYPLLSTLIHSYPLLSTLIHSYPLLSHSYPLLSHSYPLLSNSYPTLIQLLSNSYPTLIHSYSLLILRVMFFTLIHSYPLLSTLIHSYPLLTNMVVSGSMGFILIWNGVSMAKIVAQNGSQRERLGCSGWLQVDTGAANVCWECWHAKKHMK